MANLSKGDKIYVAGHRGLVGSAIVRSLKRAGYSCRQVPRHRSLDTRKHGSARLPRPQRSECADNALWQR